MNKNNPISNARTVKHLKSQLAIMQGDAESMKIEISNLQKSLSQKLKDAEVMKMRINNIDSNGKIKVSEHAIVRYFERVKGFDIKEIENEILSDEVLKMVDVLGGNGAYPNKGFQVKMSNFTVTTIV